MSLNGASELALATLVTFTWGDSSVARYTTFANPITIGDETFAVEPSIEINMNRQSGGAADTPIDLKMLVRAPLDTLTTQRAHSKVHVVVEEVDPLNTGTRTKLFAGTAKISQRNVDGRTGVVALKIGGWRMALEVMTNSWIASTTCNNVFGDVICGIDLETKRETATISAIDGNQVTLTGLTTTATAGYWRFGYVTFDGLSIKVREYITGSSMELLKTPPASWAGQEVTLTPGCDGRLATCRFWNNEGRFTGFGFKIPAYNPLLEAP